MDERSATRISRRWPLISAIVAVGVGAGLGLLIMERSGNLPLPFDSEWMEEVLDSRAIWLDLPAMLMNWLGGGWFGVAVVPGCTIILLCAANKNWGALYYAAAALVSVGLVQLLKALINRPRPEDILVVADVGSFPSGHVANAATMAVALALIFGRTWVWAVGIAYTALMVLSRTYLGAHWLSDTIGGVLVGAGVAVIVWSPFAYRLNRERPAR